MRGNFENTGKLVKFMLKREFRVAVIWLLILVPFSALLAPGMTGMFDAESRTTFAYTFNNPVMVAMMGPVYGIDNYTEGAMYSNMMLLWIIIGIAIMNVFLVSRHTRGDEEQGRGEVIRSLPVGRLSNLTAAMITAVIVNVTIGMLIGLGIAVTRVNTMGFAASMLYGVICACGGLVFAAIAALFCQLFSGKGSANGFSFLALGVFYMVRAAGDMNGTEALSLVSPLGLSQRAQIFVENYWWPVPILLIEFITLTLAAFYLNSIRDLDQGFIAAKPGRRDASKALRSPTGLAVRLLRNLVIIWVILMFVLGASYGSIIGDISSFVGNSPDYLQLLGMPAAVVASMTDAMKEEIVQNYFMSFVAVMMTLISIVPLLNAAMKTRAEERENRSEHILSRVVSRLTYIAGYTAIAFILSVLVQGATAVGIYAAAAPLFGEANPFTLGVLMKANLAYLPAEWIMIGFAVFIVGLFPKFTGVVWGYYAFVCFTAFLGSFLGLPEWIMNLAPLTHVSKAILVELEYAPLIVMTCIAAALTAAGFVFYKRREMVPA